MLSSSLEKLPAAHDDDSQPRNESFARIRADSIHSSSPQAAGERAEQQKAGIYSKWEVVSKTKEEHHEVMYEKENFPERKH